MEKKLLKFHKVVSPKKPVIPIIGEVLVKNGLMYSTDLEVSFVSRTDVPDGLYQYVDDTIEKSVLPPEDYPAIDREFLPIQMVKHDGLYDAIVNASNFTAKDDSRFSLKSVEVILKEDKIIVFATDGHFAIKEVLQNDEVVPVLEENKANRYFLVRPQAVALLKKMKNCSISMTKLTDESIIITTPYGYIKMAKCDQSVPSFDKIFAEPKETIAFRKDTFLEALKTIKPYCHKNRETKFPISVAIKMLEAPTEELPPAFNRRLILNAYDPDRNIEKSVEVMGCSILGHSYPERISVFMPLRSDDDTSARFKHKEEVQGFNYFLYFNAELLEICINSAKDDVVFYLSSGTSFSEDTQLFIT